jgi:HK97 family phage prohead protease
MTTVTVPVGLDLDTVQLRRVAVKGVDDEGLVEAQIVPYETEAQVGEGVWEIFTRGAFAAAIENPSRCKLTNQGHDRGVVIGHAVELRDEREGLRGKLRVADTTHGRDVLALFRAGSLSELSVEFRPQKKYMKFTQRAGGGVLMRHDRAVLVGVSPVGAGAYGDQARVLMMREQNLNRAREEALARLNSLHAGPKRS